MNRLAHTLLSTLRWVVCLVAVFCALPALAENTEANAESSETESDGCTAEKCCEQSAPIQALILTIARCTEEPTPAGICEVHPIHQIPERVLRCVRQLGPSKTTHHNNYHNPNSFLVESNSKHQPAPTPTQTFPEERVLGASTVELPSVFCIDAPVCLLTPNAQLLPGVHSLPETPG